MDKVTVTSIPDDHTLGKNEVHKWENQVKINYLFITNN